MKSVDVTQALINVCSYRKDKIRVCNLNPNIYISTENMKSNRAGVEPASCVPLAGSVAAYEPGDILISNIRPYFKKIWKAKNRGGCSNDVLVFKAGDNVDKDFLYYVLSDDAFFDFMMMSSKGTKMPRGDKKVIMTYPVPLFSLEKQRKIASILSAFDDKIEINNAICRNLEEQMKSLYEYLFVHNSMPEWRIGNISDLGEIVGGGTPSKKESTYYTQRGIPWITPKDLSRNPVKFIERGEIDITHAGLDASSATIMPTGTVLYSSRAPIGYIAIANNNVTTNQGFKSVIPKSSIGPAYIYYFLKRNKYAIEMRASGSTFPEVSASTMKQIPAIIPDQISLKVFNDFCNPMFEIQRKLEAEILSLSQTRDALLTKLMSGVLDVADIL